MASALVPGVGRRYGACRSSGAAEYSHRWEHGFSAGTRISAPSWAATDVQARAWGPGKPGALTALPIPCKRTKAHKSAFGARDKLRQHAPIVAWPKPKPDITPAPCVMGQGKAVGAKHRTSHSVR